MTAYDTAEIRGQIRDWRRGRVDLRWGEVLSEAYIIVLAVVMLGSMLISAIVHAGASASACGSPTCESARAAVPVLVGLLWLTATVALMSLLGPLVASKATSSIVLATPVDRATWLRRQFAVALGVCATAGTALTLGVAVMTGWPLLTAAALAIGCGLVTVLGYAAGASVQVEPPRWWSVVRRLPAVVLVGSLIALAFGPDGIRPPTSVLWWGAPALAAVVAIPVVMMARRRLGSLRRRDLVRGHGIAQGLAGAMAGLDPALAFDVVLAQAAERRSVVRPRRGGINGPWAMAGADLHRLRRSPLPLIVLAATLAIPFAATGAGAGSLGIPLTIIAAFLAAIPLGAGLRVLGRTPGVSRLLGHPPRSLRAAAIAVPGAVLVIYGILAVPALPSASPMLGLAVGVGSTAALARWIMAAPPDYSRPLVSTPMGGMPTNLYGSAIRGFDIAGLVSIPMLFAPNAAGGTISIVISGIVLAVLIMKK